MENVNFLATGIFHLLITKSNVLIYEHHRLIQFSLMN